MRISTRRSASFGTTRILCVLDCCAVAFCLTLLPSIHSIASAASKRNFVRTECMDDLPTHHDFLLGIIKGNPLAGLHGSDAHAKGDGMAVTGFDISIGCLAAAHAFHPVAQVGSGGGMRVRVRSRFRASGTLRECCRL